MTDISLSTFFNQLADTVASAAPSVVQVLGHRRPASGIVFDANAVLTAGRSRRPGRCICRHGLQVGARG